MSPAGRAAIGSEFAMISPAKLRAMEDAIGDQRVLTAYASAFSDDPAKRTVWRMDLRRSLADLRRWLADSPHEEREQFNASAAALDALLQTVPDGLGAPGLVAFVTGDGVREAWLTPVSMPTVAVWSTGPCIAPLARAIKEARPVILAVTDAKRTDIYRYRGRNLRKIQQVRAFNRLGPPLRLGNPPRTGFNPGTRGRTGREAMQRARLHGHQRMARSVAAEILEQAGQRGWIVVAGETKARTLLAAALESAAPDRLAVLGSPSRDAGDAELARLARRGASKLRETANSHRVERLVASPGSSAIGASETARALAEKRVRELLFTKSFLDASLADAEDAIRAALSQGAAVEEVTGRPARRLDRLGGIAARLRYPQSA
jgi:hypothetical protein